ncbi:protein translocase subunit SecD [Sphingosinicella sp. YJ22]|uniref:protein translocase subunit SecD n=1 Tax=Sphingosinicella sp. YJ22 TaxID=1104780 RepID=UPI00140C89E4|nr:protein translocase subunit SecD [Sphingosinicella sp. YJ22]
MLNFARWQIFGITLICLIGVLLAVPSLLPSNLASQVPWAPKVNLGLDLAGGSHLLLEADTSSLTQQRLEALEDSVRGDMRRNEIEIAELSTANNQLAFLVRNPAQTNQAADLIRRQAQPTLMGGTTDWTVSTEGNRVIVRPTEAGQAAAVDNAMEVAREVIDRRINALGTLEPTIIRQGRTRIVVQVPGLQDPEQLKSLIGRTARLEFKMVTQGVTQEQLDAGRPPVGSQILPMEGGGNIAVERRAIVTGDQVADAQQAFDQQDGQPVVTIRFDSAGGQRFARATQQNVGRPFAIILDNVVLSAPVIQEPILGGTAQVRGSFTVESANQLAISLRSGRLPVELSVVEERTVGPDLGADSIRQGMIATAIGAALVMLFIFATYGKFGLFANAALILNVLLILGWMALFNATLTLPGIAGFVLTIGAAVDANIIINERIREELRRGRTVLDAIDTGWKEASTAILDANITNAIAGALMFYFGSGPIRGFAVVLVIGIVTSAFTAITVARMMVALWVRRARPKQLVL